MQCWRGRVVFLCVAVFLMESVSGQSLIDKILNPAVSILTDGRNCFRTILSSLFHTSSITTTGSDSISTGNNDDDNDIFNDGDLFETIVDEDDLIPANIVNGVDADIKHWPFVGYLEYVGSFTCTCTLTIPTTRVITAAHCVSGMSVESFTVVLGLQSRSSLSEDITQGHAVRIPVLSIQVHRTYKASGIRNDIAVLTLSAEPPLSDSIQPIPAIADGSDTFLENDNCFAIGYGAVAVETIDGETESTLDMMLQEINLPVITNTVCSKYYYHVLKSNICAFMEVAGGAVCFGDSGGPFVCEVNNEWNLVGTTSFGNRDCTGPSVFTRMSSYTSWLSDHASSAAPTKSTT